MVTMSGEEDTGGALVNRYHRFRDSRGLGSRVSALEVDVAEVKQLSLRIAELTDLVGELVIELARMDPARASEILDRYQGELGS
ncbi:DUF6752 domain-containing protein [Nocardioides sp.]|uniref:DUF6752 domain-containing protein n=1 Tax=Nocardioides sp. TaxID=35761 RepID=UPI003563550D